MKLVKILGTAAICAAPLSVAAAQSAATPDSGPGNHTGKWIAATSTVAGAALFLAFTKSGGSNANSIRASDAGPSAPTPPPPTTTSATQPAASPPAASPPDSSATTQTPGITPPAGANAPGDTPASEPTPPPVADNPTPDNPTPDYPTTTRDFVATRPTNYPPHEESLPGLGNSSTVPEPGSLVLTATGIIGLLPLISRRRRRR